jgi:hypothetical protein
MIADGQVTLREVLDASDGELSGAMSDAGHTLPKSRNPKESLFDEDPSQPLNNRRHEEFVRLRVEGFTLAKAYTWAISDRCTQASAQQQASHLMKIRRIRLRYEYKKAQNEQGKLQAARAPVMDSDGPLSRQEIIKALRAIYNDPLATKTEKLKVLQQLDALRKGGEKRKKAVVDPVYMCEYLRQAARQGKDPVALAREEQAQEALSDEELEEIIAAGEEDPDRSEPQDVVPNADPDDSDE